MESEDKQADRVLSLLLVSGIGQVSNRLYYLYYRTLQSIEGQQESLSKFAFGTIAGSVTFVVTVVNLVTSIQAVDVGIKLIVLLGSAVASAVTLWTVYQYWIPKGKWEDTQATVRLEIHLSEIRSVMRDLRILRSMIPRTNQVAQDLEQNDRRILSIAIDHVTRLRKKLEPRGQYLEYLKSIKENENSVNQLIEQAEMIAKGGGTS